MDQTWYTGSTWARPILTGDNPINSSITLSSCSYQVGSLNNFFELGGLKYYIIDNFEMVGLCQSDVGQPGHHDIFVSYGSICNSGCSGGIPLILINLYMHGWSHVQFAGSNGSGSCTGSNVCFNIFVFNGAVIGGGVGESVHNNVVDGSDSDPGGAGLCFGGFYDVAYNVFRNTSQCVVGSIHLFHDHMKTSTRMGTPMSLNRSLETAGTNAVYNNVFRHLETAASSMREWQQSPLFWRRRAVAAAGGTTDYFFNNLIYDVGNMEYFNIGNHGSTLGNYTIFSNTFQTNVNQTIFNCQYLFRRFTDRYQQPFH